MIRRLLHDCVRNAPFIVVMSLVLLLACEGQLIGPTISIPHTRSVKLERIEELERWDAELREIAADHECDRDRPFDQIDFRLLAGEVIPHPTAPGGITVAYYTERGDRGAVVFVERAYGPEVIYHELAHALCNYGAGPGAWHLHSIFRDPRMDVTPNNATGVL